MVSALVCMPLFIALLVHFAPGIHKAWGSWREACAMHPGFPPSAIDFFWRGKQTCLPEHTDFMSSTMPSELQEQLDDTVDEISCEATTGVCKCFVGYVSSDGSGNSGQRSDCGFRDALSPGG